MAQALDSKQAKTSFGKLPLSIEKSEPIFGFPQAKRDDNEKVYMGELTKTANTGKCSPGPIYNYEDSIKYKDVIYSLDNSYSFLPGASALKKEKLK